MNSPKLKIYYEFLKKFFRIYFPILIFNITTNLLISVDLFFVKSLSTNENSNYISGIYSASSVLSKAFLMALIPISNALFPIVSSLVSKKKFESKNKLTKSSLSFVHKTVIPISILVSVNGIFVIQLLYGKEYLDGAKYFLILAISMSIYGIYQIIMNLLIAEGKTNQVVVLSIVSTVISMIILWFIAKEGVQYISFGVFCYVLITYVTGIIYLSLVQKQFPIDIEAESILIVSCFMVLTYYFFKNLVLQITFSFLTMVYLVVLGIRNRNTITKYIVKLREKLVWKKQ